MVRGLQVFREHFRTVADTFVVIGGGACDEWFEAQGLRFRATRDVDMVLLLEAKDEGFAQVFWNFIRAGQYENRQKSTGKRIYYRFYGPKTQDYPEMIELFSRSPAEIEVGHGQAVVPIPFDDDLSSLSAILMDDTYYEFVRANCELREGLLLPRLEVLIALKAVAWLDLDRRKSQGERVDSKHLKKHRNDIFRLAHILPVGEQFRLPLQVQQDIASFLDVHPASDTSTWQGITNAVKTSIPAAAVRQPPDLLAFITDYFRLA